MNKTLLLFGAGCCVIFGAIAGSAIRGTIARHAEASIAEQLRETEARALELDGQLVAVRKSERELEHDVARLLSPRAQEQRPAKATALAVGSVRSEIIDAPELGAPLTLRLDAELSRTLGGNAVLVGDFVIELEGEEIARAPIDASTSELVISSTALAASAPALRYSAGPLVLASRDGLSYGARFGRMWQGATIGLQIGAFGAYSQKVGATAGVSAEVMW